MFSAMLMGSSSKYHQSVGNHSKFFNFQSKRSASFSFTDLRGGFQKYGKKGFLALAAVAFGCGISALFYSQKPFFLTANGDHDASNSIRVVTYNVLSSSFCSPAENIFCKAEDLDESVRLERVLEQLVLQMSKGAIICLQEVSTLWGGKMHAFFQQRGYHFALRNCGNSFSGYMGVAIAWPVSKYNAVDVDFVTVADVASKWPKDLWAQSSSHSSSSSPATRFNPWQAAKQRANAAIVVRLNKKKQEKDTPQSFCVATYHMPCLFGSDEKCQVMIMHAALLCQHLHKFAGTDPYILAGDFNIKPHDPTYDLILSGKLPEGHPQLPVGCPTNIWQPTLPVPLRSAYKEANGQEPNFTNFSCIAMPGCDIKKVMPFIETLDYIFLSKGWRVKNVGKLPLRNEVEGPFPNATNPSDHIMLSASLKIE